jgi:NADPH:quinone reductase-like Zn-dependent oxidoreductase
VSLADVVRGS